MNKKDDDNDNNGFEVSANSKVIVRPSYNLITMKERVRMSNFVVNSELLQKSEENEEEFEYRGD